MSEYSQRYHTATSFIREHCWSECWEYAKAQYAKNGRGALSLWAPRRAGKKWSIYDLRPSGLEWASYKPLGELLIDLKDWRALLTDVNTYEPDKEMVIIFSRWPPNLNGTSILLRLWHEVPPPPKPITFRQLLLADAYAILHLPVSSTLTQVKDARKRLARLYHPDMGGDLDMMQKVNAACDAIIQAAI